MFIEMKNRVLKNDFSKNKIFLFVFKIYFFNFQKIYQLPSDNNSNNNSNSSNNNSYNKNKTNKLSVHLDKTNCHIMISSLGQFCLIGEKNNSANQNNASSKTPNHAFPPTNLTNDNAAMASKRLRLAVYAPMVSPSVEVIIRAYFVADTPDAIKVIFADYGGVECGIEADHNGDAAVFVFGGFVVGGGVSGVVGVGVGFVVGVVGGVIGFGVGFVVGVLGGGFGSFSSMFSSLFLFYIAVTPLTIQPE